MKQWARALALLTAGLALGTGAAESARAATTVRASVSSGEVQGSGLSGQPDVTPNGQLVAFASEGVLASGDSNGASDIYLRDTRGHHGAGVGGHRRHAGQRRLTLAPH